MARRRKRVLVRAEHESEAFSGNFATPGQTSKHADVDCFGLKIASDVGIHGGIGPVSIYEDLFAEFFSFGLEIFNPKVNDLVEDFFINGGRAFNGILLP